MLPVHKSLIDFLNNRFENAATAPWPALVTEAGRHRLAPLLYRKIKDAGAEKQIPPDVLLAFRKQYLATAARNTVFFHQLDELVASLNTQKIPVILLKGAHLAQFVYKDIALRPMSDIDIMVKEEHLSDAVRIAFEAGYQFFYEKKSATRKTGDGYNYDILEHYKHFQPLIHPETGSLLEIHCFLANVGTPFNIIPAELWDAAQPAALNRNTVFLLSPEDLIIHLCHHAAYDHLFGFGLGALYDIFITIQHYERKIDWQEIVSRSEEWKTHQCLILSLYFTQKWLSANIPEAIFENFQVDETVNDLESRIFDPAVTAPLHPHYIQWRNLQNTREKIHYIKKVLLPSRDFMLNRYIKSKHSKILVGSYFFRALQALKGIISVMNAALRDRQYISRIKRGNEDYRLRKWLTRV